MKTTVEAFIEWFGNKPAGSLKKRKLYKYLDLLESKKYNPTSQSMFLRRLKILFNWGYKNDSVSNQPFKGFDIPAWEMLLKRSWMTWIFTISKGFIN